MLVLSVVGKLREYVTYQWILGGADTEVLREQTVLLMNGLARNLFEEDAPAKTQIALLEQDFSEANDT